MNALRTFLILAVLGMLLAACSMPTTSVPQATIDPMLMLQTAVAGTQTAIAGPVVGLPTQEPLLATPQPLAGETVSAPLANRPLLVYLDGSWRLKAWTPDGGVRPLTNEGSIQQARISPDGSRVAFLRHNDYRDFSLWVIDINGANERQLVSPEDFNGMLIATDALGAAPAQFEWVPGTLNLAFNTYPYYEGPGFYPHDDLWLLDTNSGQFSQFLAPGEGGMFAYSPDGTRLAVSTHQTVSLLNADGSNRQDDVLIYEPVLTYSDYLYYVRPVWSPDGSHLRAIVPPGDPLAEPSEPTTIWHIPADGSSAQQIGSLNAAFLDNAILSPDLGKVVYLEPIDEANRDLRLANADGSADAVYANGVNSIAGWAPDSTQFVYSTGNPNTLVLGRVGGNPTPLTEFPEAISAEWIDSQYFVFLRPVNNSFELRLGQPGGPSVLIEQLQSEDEYYFPEVEVLP